MTYGVLAACLVLVVAVLLWPIRQHKIFSLVTCLLFFISGFKLYAMIGNPGIVPLLEARKQHLEELERTITEQSTIVKKDPHTLSAWVQLGQAFMETGQFAAAVNAFKQAVRLSAGDPILIMAYAKAMIFEADGKVDDHAKKSLEMVLLQEPENEEAQYFLIVRKLQDGKTEVAMAEMKALYRSLPDNSPLREMIDRQIGK